MLLQMANRSRGPNMSLQEDIALCKAYVTISEDPLTASQQKKDKFWDRIYQEFESLTPNIHQRTSGTLANRFALISRDVFLYIEKLAQVEKRKESSWTEADVICEARKDFRTNYNKAFGFEECYQILKSIPKYSLNTVRMENTCSSQEEGGASSLATPSGHNVNLNPDIDAIIDLEAPYDSPPGRTSEKKRARKKAKGVDTSMCSSILEETTTFNAFFKETALKKEEDRKALNAKIDKLIEIKEKEEEDRIMSIDLNSVSEHQRIYFERRQTEVLTRRDLL